MESKIGLT